MFSLPRKRTETQLEFPSARTEYFITAILLNMSSAFPRVHPEEIEIFVWARGLGM